MSVPKPTVDLTGACSVVFNSTLYSFSASAFQSLELAKGASWNVLPMGVAVNGGVCVKAIPNGDVNSASLYIVGGTVTDSSLSTSYPGIQRFNFASQTWEWVQPTTSVTQSRLNHAAVFLNATQSILVYAGSQDNSTGLSSQTFLIQTTAPYGVQAYTSNAPPAQNPILLPWDESHAVMIGGNADNTAVFTFEQNAGWQNLGVVLPTGIQNEATTSCTILSGDDGSKVLETYDFGVSPNTVTQLVLLEAGGAVAATGQAIGSEVKRLTLESWPAYNSTLAPTVTRSGFSLAQDDVSGKVVVSGGSSDDPLCMFDERENTWLNTSQVFQDSTVQQITIQSAPTSSSLSSSATIAATATSSSSTLAAATSTAAAAVVATSSGGQDKSRMLTVLGATLGAIFGIAAILILILILLRWRKQRKQREGDGYIEKDRLSFADRGAEYMREAGGSAGGHYEIPRGPGSHSSLSIMQGRVGHKRGKGNLGSDSSTAYLVTNKKSPLGYSEPLEMSSIGEKMSEVSSPSLTVPDGQLHPNSQPAGPQHGHSRSSGWSRYFSNNEATNLANMTSGRSTFASERDSDASQYTDSRIISQPSQAPAPLDLIFTKFDGQRLSRVATGSPSLGHSREDLRGQPMQAELARANSVGSSVSSISEYPSANGGATTGWTPVEGGNGWNQRPPSSTYTNSNRNSAFTPKDGSSSYYPTDNKSSYYAKSGISTLYGLYGSKPEEQRESTVTVFPRGIPAEDKRRVPARTNTGGASQATSDMSWLNLGAGAT